MLPRSGAGTSHAAENTDAYCFSLKKIGEYKNEWPFSEWDYNIVIS